MLAHGFRKFYCTNLGRARLQSSKIDALMGWKKGLLHVYDRSGLDELLSEYLKAVDLLTINDENRLRARVATLEEDKDRTILELQNQIKTLREDRGQEIAKLEERIKKVDEMTPRLLKTMEYLETKIKNLEKKAIS
jgi:DNA anti-recombination protein RmuC